MPSSTPLSINEISQLLGTTHLGRTIHLHPELGSTNAEALALAQTGALHGTVVLAETQTAGRGRRGRTWFSPPGKNVYASIILRSGHIPLPLQDWLPWVPLVSALAVAQAVQTVVGIRVDLKWPNDLLRQNRKVGGILCESLIASPTEATIIIGMGLNVNVLPTEFPAGLQDIATSLINSESFHINRNQLIAQALLEIESLLSSLSSTGLNSLRHTYQSACITIGKSVRVLLGNQEELLGRADAIEPDGALLVRPFPTASNPTPAPIAVRAADVIHLR